MAFLKTRKTPSNAENTKGLRIRVGFFKSFWLRIRGHLRRVGLPSRTPQTRTAPGPFFDLFRELIVKLKGPQLTSFYHVISVLLSDVEFTTSCHSSLEKHDEWLSNDAARMSEINHG